MSWGAVAGIMLTAVVLPYIVNEGGELAPWLAERLLRRAAKLLGSREATERYAEEWLANLEHVPGKITKLGWACGLLLLSVPRLRWQARSRERGMLPLLHVDQPQLAGFRVLLKSLFDRCAAGLALVMLAPVITALVATIWLDDRGPALFSQVRVGKDGHAFRMYKFRTMVVGAEQRRAELLAVSNSDGVLFSLRRDPRVTRIGQHLRRWSVDELSNLFNVFFGHMSLVGPRPALPDEAAEYAEHVRRRLVVKPGLTGLWQVNGRSDLSWEESVRLDLRYVENWSFALDLQILWKTIAVILRGSGAY